MKVRFSETTNSKLLNHFNLFEFGDAVAITDEIETSSREDKKQFTTKFEIINNDKVMYTGTLNFGSYDYANLYEQMKENIPRIKTSKENAHLKDFLLESIEKETEDMYKNREKVDKTLINLEKTNISKLKSWQRKTLYSIAGVFALMTMFLFVGMTSQKAQYEKALADGRELVSAAENYNEVYESALLGDENKLFNKLKSEEKLNKNQEKILVDKLLVKDDFATAVKVLDSQEKVADLLLLSPMNNEVKKEKISKFNELYPSNTSKFDLAYFNKEYDLMLNIKNVQMTTKRSEMKTYALIKLNKIDDAKVELSNNNNEDLSKKIATIEGLKAEVTTLQSQLNKVKGNKKKRSEANKIRQKIKETNEKIRNF